MMQIKYFSTRRAVEVVKWKFNHQIEYRIKMRKDEFIFPREEN